MSGESEADELMDSFQDTQLGIFLLLIIVLGASIPAQRLESIGVPFGTEIGALGGGILTFLAISYWYYGR